MDLHGPAADGHVAGDQAQRRHRVAGGVHRRDERQVDRAARPGVAAEDEGDERHGAPVETTAFQAKNVRSARSMAVFSPIRREVVPP